MRPVADLSLTGCRPVNAAVLDGYRAPDGTRATLVLDFVGGVFAVDDQLVAPHAAGSPAIASPLVLGAAAGGLRTLGPGEAAIGHDPATGHRLGLAVEPGKTNLLANSASLLETDWTLVGATLTTDTGPPPLAGAAAFRLTSTSGDSAHGVDCPSVTVTAGERYCFSVHARAVDADRLGLALPTEAFGAGAHAVFDLASGSVADPGGADAGLEPLAGGWVRCRLSAVAIASLAARARISIQNGASYQASHVEPAARSLLLFAPQAETGAVATSPLLASGAPASRAADAFTAATAGWLTQDEGTFVVDMVCNDDSRNVILVELNDGTWATRFGLQLLGGQQPRWFESIGNASAAGGSLPTGTAATLAVAHGAGSIRAAAAGQALADQAASLPAGLTTLRLGSSPATTENLFGHLRRVLYYPKKLSAADLLTVTQ